MRLSTWIAVVAAVVVAAPAFGQSDRTGARARPKGQGWSLHSHQTVGAGQTAVGAEIGFPGLNLHALYGLQDGLDIGGRFSLNYAYESMVTQIYPGVKAEAVGRLRLFEGERVGLAVTFGLFVFGTFAPASPAVVGLGLPLGLVVGIPIGSALVANFGLDVPMFVTFGFGGGLTVPALAGVGLEYFLDKSLAISLNTRMGPVINPTVLRVNTAAELGFRAQLGVTLRL